VCPPADAHARHDSTSSAKSFRTLVIQHCRRCNAAENPIVLQASEWTSSRHTLQTLKLVYAEVFSRIIEADIMIIHCAQPEPFRKPSAGSQLRCRSTDQSACPYRFLTAHSARQIVAGFL